MLKITEDDEISVPIHSGIRSWDKNHIFYSSLPQEYRDNSLIYDKLYVLCSAFCVTPNMLKNYRNLMEKFLKLLNGQYLWGMDEAVFNYLYHSLNKKHEILDAPNYIGETYFPNIANIKEHLYCNNQLIKIINNSGGKDKPHRLLFSDKCLFDLSDQLSQQETFIAEEKAYQLCLQNSWSQGTYLFRTYIDPQNLYGNMEDNLSS